MPIDTAWGVAMAHAGTADRHSGWLPTGIPFEKPVRLMREYLDGLLPLLDGKPAEAVGEMVTTRATLQIAGAPTPQVYLAALGPQMLKLAGRRTAGTVTLLAGPKTLSEHIGPTLREAAEAAGRPAKAVRVVAVLPVSVTDDVDSARALAAEEFALHGQLPSYRAVLDREQEPNNNSWIMTVIHHVSAERPCATAQLLTVTYSKGPEHGHPRCVTMTDSCCACSARPVDMGAVPDTDDDHSVLVLVDTENDPVVASAGCAIAVHLAS
jgi:hypothetical protein